MRRLRVALLVSLGVAVLAPSAAIAFDAIRHAPATSSPGRTLEPLRAAPRTTARETPPALAQSTAPSPGSADDPLPARIGDALNSQEAALLAGDAAGFLAPVDPSNTALRGELSRRFGSLRAMRVAVWDEAIAGAPARGADGSWTVPTQVTYCFVVPDCIPLRLPITTRWTDAGDTQSAGYASAKGAPAVAGGLRMVAFGTSSSDDLGPRPWEVADLRVAVGPRVVIATTARFASRLPAMLAAAEKAAAVTDRFARWDKPPGRYVVYIAGPDEWGKWYGVAQQSWVAAFAMPLTDNSTEVVLNANHVDTRDTTEVLRHEFTHVVTLVGVSRSYDHSWWLVEGIAEYVRVAGGSRPFDGLADVRRYVRGGQWSGDVVLDGPPQESTATDVNGRYGVAYLAVRRLADRFGEDKMLAFFAAVARTGTPLAQASTSVFGVSWDGVSADCARFVRAKAA